jgi:predicted enzyme related to lactoylglutathione lyase
MPDDAGLYHAGVIRLRQVVLAARDLDTTVDRLCAELALSVCFNDPGVAEFGLHNALMSVGDQFIEVVSPIADNAAAGRLLDRRNASVCAYMVMFEVDDLDTRLEALTAAGVRTVWSGDFPTIRGRHLHPADVGGAIVSLDQTDPPGSWMWGGPTWTAHSDNSVVTAVAGYTIATDDPAAVTTLWSLFGLLQSVRFVEGTNSVIDLAATDRTSVGRTVTLDQVTLRLV